MDFLEGALLGPLWSDTDYEDKSHRFLAFVYVVIIYSAVFYLFRQAHTPLFFEGMVVLLWLALTVLMMVISSFLASRYYHCGLGGRIGILAIISTKYIAATCFLVSCFRPFYSMDMPAVKDWLLNFLNNTAGDFVSQAAERFRIMGLILSAVLVGALAFVAVIAFLVLLVLIPVLFLHLIRFLQNSLDSLLLHSRKTV